MLKLRSELVCIVIAAELVGLGKVNLTLLLLGRGAHARPLQRLEQ